MRNAKVLLLLAVFAAGVLSAQTPQPAQSSPQNSTPNPPLPVPGGGAGLGPGGIPTGPDRPTPTKEEALQKAKQQAEQMSDLQARRITQQLSLSAAQFTKVRAILIERDDILRKTFSPDAPGAAEHPFTPTQRQQKLQEVKEATLNKIRAVLNPQQKLQFEAMMARGRTERSRQAARAANRHPNQPGVPAVAPTPTPTPAQPATPPQSPN